jgi:hypothetical protein
MAATLRTIVPLIPAGPVSRDAIAFFAEQMGFTITWESEIMSVDDLDALYQEFKDIPVNIKAPEMQPWGRREFHMIVPSGVCLQFYEAEPQE